MLVDVTYFTAGPRHVLNATQGTLTTEVNDAISHYIAYLQPKFLVELLGESVGNEMQSYLVAKDRGIVALNEDMEAICEHIDEAFADYVYFHILRDSGTQATITGVVRLKNANTPISPLSRQVSVWNDMVQRVRMFASWCQTNEASEIDISSNLMTPINRFNI